MSFKSDRQRKFVMAKMKGSSRASVSPQIVSSPKDTKKSQFLEVEASKMDTITGIRKFNRISRKDWFFLHRTGQTVVFERKK